MNLPTPTPSYLEACLATFERHPFGALVLVALVYLVHRVAVRRPDDEKR